MKGLKNRIEENGIQCWMDIGQMGGGDALFAKIDAGIRACKVSGRVRIALISPSRDIREFLYRLTSFLNRSNMQFFLSCKCFLFFFCLKVIRLRFLSSLLACVH